MTKERIRRPLKCRVHWLLWPWGPCPPSAWPLLALLVFAAEIRGWRPYGYDLWGVLPRGAQALWPSLNLFLALCRSMRPMAPWPRVAEGGDSLCSVHSRVTLPRKFTPPATSWIVSHCGFPRKARSPGLLPDHTSTQCDRGEQGILGLLTRAQVVPVSAIPSDSMMRPCHLYTEAWRGEIGTHIWQIPPCAYFLFPSSHHSPRTKSIGLPAFLGFTSFCHWAAGIGPGSHTLWENFLN